VTVLAQSLGEYGAAGGLLDRFAATVSSGTQWMQTSFQQSPTVWIAAAVCLVIVVWLFRGR
jgi:hypothetical protein